jgi:hypothetical protein
MQRKRSSPKEIQDKKDHQRARRRQANLAEQFLKETLLVAADFAARMNQMDAGVWDDKEGKWVREGFGFGRADLNYLLSASNQGSKAMQLIAFELGWSPDELNDHFRNITAVYEDGPLDAWYETGVQLYAENYPDDDDDY